MAQPEAAAHAPLLAWGANLGPAPSAKLHIAPRLGKREPDSIRPREIVEALRAAYEEDKSKRRPQGKVGAKTVKNLKSTLSRIYGYGAFQEYCDNNNNPCRQIPKDALPKPGKAKRPAYTEIEGPLLMAHQDEADPQFQILYKLFGGAGSRLGEGCGAHFSDIDWNAPIVPSLHVGCQYQDELLNTHGLRRYFITQARRGGARPDMLRRVTHNPSGDIIDVYTDAEGLRPALCEAVQCLKVQWPTDKLVQLPVAVNDSTDKLTDNAANETGKPNEREALLAPQEILICKWGGDRPGDSPENLSSLL